MVLIKMPTKTGRFSCLFLFILANISALSPQKSFAFPRHDDRSGLGSRVTCDKLRSGNGLASLKYLLFDGHAGPLSSILSFLVTNIGVPSRNIHIACHPFGCNRLHMNIPLPLSRLHDMEKWMPMNHDFENMEPIYDEGWRELFRQQFQSIVDDFDVLMCSQPMKLCSLLRVFGKPVVIRADKRFDHRVGMNTDVMKDRRFGLQTDVQVSVARRSSWARELASWAKSKDNTLIILHANPYDEAYMSHYLGLSSTLLEAYPVWPRWQTTWRPVLDDIIVIPDQEALLGQRREWEKTVVIPLQESGLNVKFMRDAYPVFTFNQLASHKAMLFLPYDANTWTQREMYSVGIPMFAPSHLRILQRVHLDTGRDHHESITWSLLHCSPSHGHQKHWFRLFCTQQICYLKFRPEGQGGKNDMRDMHYFTICNIFLLQKRGVWKQ